MQQRGWGTQGRSKRLNAITSLCTCWSACWSESPSQICACSRYLQTSRRQSDCPCCPSILRFCTVLQGLDVVWKQILHFQDPPQMTLHPPRGWIFGWLQSCQYSCSKLGRLSSSRFGITSEETARTLAATCSSHTAA